MKLIKRTLQVILILIVGYIVYYAWRAFPILSSYGAKNMCSCVMLAGRDPQSVLQNELGPFPFNLGTFKVDFRDSSATGSVFGLAKRKAIYRKGLGCTLVVGSSEADVRAQPIQLAHPPAVNQDTIAWPDGDKLPDSVTVNFDHKKLDSVVNSAFTEPGPKTERRTRAILVVYHDQIIAEKYAPGFDKNSTQLGWSMTKSLTNALVGILVKEGKLTIDAPAPVAQWKNDSRSSITLNDLMHQSSGLEWNEFYFGPSTATTMLFKRKDMGLYAASLPLERTPGEVFKYSSGTTNIISRIIRETVGDNDYYAFPYDQLFYKLHMYSMTLEPDAGGTFVGSSYSWATARDWARFGLFFLHDGVWDGERLLPEGWVKYSTTPAKGAHLGQYGAQFWLNAGATEDPQVRYYPNDPTDLYWADGFEGQNVFVLPSKDLVVVKLSQTTGDALNDDQFLKGVIESLK